MVVVLAAAVTTAAAVDMGVEMLVEEAMGIPAIPAILGGKHIIIALRMFGPFFSS